MSSIRQLVATLDDASWEALASKGLLRRATKEIEKGIACRVDEETAFGLTLTVGECTVRFPAEGPAKARCSCGAPGCCQHVIAAGLFLRRSAKNGKADDDEPGSSADKSAAAVEHAAAERTTLREELLGLDWSVVRRWAGASAWRSGMRLLASGVEVEPREEGGAIEVLLQPMAVRCHFLPGTGLDGAIVSGVDVKAVRSFVVLAIAGFKMHHGQSLPKEESGELVLAEESGAPRSRAEVLRVATQLLELAVETGLARAGGSIAERFATLAVSAEGTNLPRLARALKAVAEELTMLANRHARADAERAVETMAHAFALAEALGRAGKQPADHLVGQHRSGYADALVLELVGLTAFPWQTRSGYRGITVLFRDRSGARWMTWTEARGATIDPSFDPLLAFDRASPWASNQVVRTIATSELRLSNARRNAAGRLSSSATCKATVLRPTELHAMDFGDRLFCSWELLERHVVATNPTGLRPSEASSDWVVVEPAGWGHRSFDRVTQRLIWPIADHDGRLLSLVLGYSDLNRSGVERLEAWAPAGCGTVRILGRFLRQGGEFAVEPLVLFSADGRFAPIHVLLPPVRAVSAVAPAGPAARVASADDEEELPEGSGELPDSPAANRWFRQVRGQLVAAAETGPVEHVTRDPEPIRKLSGALADSGLPVLAGALARVVDCGLESRPASELLRAAYVLRLHEQCSTFGQER